MTETTVRGVPVTGRWPGWSVSAPALGVLLLALAACTDTNPTVTDAAARTGRPDTTPPASSSTTSTREAADGEPFAHRWTTNFDGCVDNVEIVDEHVLYVALGCDGLDIVALDPATGNEHWRHNLKAEGNWTTPFNLASTSDGVMTSYEDDDGGHVVLVEQATGQQRWNVPIGISSAYELRGEIADGIGSLLVSEDEAMLVNLATGAELTDLNIDYVIDGRAATQDGTMLRVDLDPLDPTTGGRVIELASATPILGAVTFDDTLVVIAEDGVISGYVDDTERWSFQFDGDASEIREVSVRGPALLVRSNARPDQPRGYWHWSYFWIDGSTVQPVSGIPDDLDFEGATTLGDVPVIIGRVDEQPGSDSGTETDQGFVMTLGPSGPTTTRSFDVAGLGRMHIVGRHLVLTDAENHLKILPLHDGEGETPEITAAEPVPIDHPGGTYAFGDDFVLVWETNEISLYR